jgi:hypothetical protein
MQNYKGIPLRLIEDRDYEGKKAKAFLVNHSKLMIWIPNKHLEADGTIQDGVDLEYVFIGELRKLEKAGVILSYEVLKADDEPVPAIVELAQESQQSSTRIHALHELLHPITWFPSSSIGYRRKIVMQRRDSVKHAYPFMNEEEKAQADEWLRLERHEELFF